jgi:pectate lyase
MKQTAPIIFLLLLFPQFVFAQATDTTTDTATNAATGTGTATNGATGTATDAATGTGTAPTQLAFAGAEGFGQFASGGRGGEIVHVTNLRDMGVGSLRDAVSKPNRIVVFDVSGIIPLESELDVSSNITIAGQTAPGDGIMVYGRNTSFTGQTNIIVRYMRFREGIQGDKGKCSVNLATGSNMIFDHCSIEWGRWDCLGLTKGSHDVTFQNCIIGEGVDPQRFGSLSDDADNITYSHNLWINNESRNPKAKGKIQYVNNVVYDWGVCGLVGGHSGADHFLDMIGNYFIAGPGSHPDSTALGTFLPTDHVYQKDNWVDLDKDGQLNGRLVVPADFGTGTVAPTFMTSLTVAPEIKAKIESAQDAFASVIKEAGCSLHRDSVDARLIDEVKSLGKSGKISNDEAEVGGPGELEEVHAVATYTDDTVQN